MVFLSSTRNMLVGKIVQTTGNCPNDIKLPKKYEIARNFEQNWPKYIKLAKILPEILTPSTNRGGQCPPAPPPPPTPMVKHNEVCLWITSSALTQISFYSTLCN